MARFDDLSVRGLLDEAASEAPTPGGGALAALTGALAAGLVEMAARNSPDWELRGAAVAQAKVLRERLAELAPLNDEVYEQALVSLQLPDGVDDQSRRALIGTSLERAAAFPLAIAEAASNVAELAAVVSEDGDPTVRADATAAAMLALGATRAAAHLVEINLGVLEHDERLLRATRLAADAAAASARSLAVAQ
ncbi:MAG TPA: cyclodeaminase/cyclohydrolase family protein [Gaiellaceae bacterium]|nr:cyclodeaminase/cyclohydrolase family protein [Gaiellaceae bacterium]